MLQLRKEGSYGKIYTLQAKFMKSNVVTSTIEDEWDAKALFVIEKEEDKLALTTTLSDQIDYEKDWIVDSGCFNHMTGDKKKLQSLTEYKGNYVVVTTNNSKLPITHVSNTMIAYHYSDNEASL